MSFTDEVTMLGDAELPVCSPESPPLILPVVVEEFSDVPEPESPSLILLAEDISGMPVEERIELVPSAPGSPHLCGQSTMGEWMWTNCVLKLVWTVQPSLSPIGQVSSDVSDATVSPEGGVLVSPLVVSSSGVAPTVGHARLPLLSVDNILVQDMLWAPAAPQYTRPNVDREIPVPRWRLAREGPFLADRSSESIRSLGAGCAFRNTTYRASDYATPVGDYGLPLHHPRFVECIGVPQSTRLIEISGGQWVSKLSRDQAVTAAVHLQRDVGLPDAD